MITEEEVRHYVLDQAAQQSRLDFGVEFSPEDIAKAMTRCARDYNSMSPTIERVNASALPDDTNVFLDGIAMHLYLGKLQCEQRTDIKYEAGNATVDAAGPQIQHYQENIKYFGERFMSAAKDRKRDLNNKAAYGRIG